MRYSIPDGKASWSELLYKAISEIIRRNIRSLEQTSNNVRTLNTISGGASEGGRGSVYKLNFVSGALEFSTWRAASPNYSKLNVDRIHPLKVYISKLEKWIWLAK